MLRSGTMTSTTVQAVVLLALFPPSLGAVLPELSLEMIRDTLATVSWGRSESLLTPYLRSYPSFTLASVTSIQLTTPYSRFVTRARTRDDLSKSLSRYTVGRDMNLNRYTEDEAERDYKLEGPEYLEAIVTISCGSPRSSSCRSDFLLNEYQITAVFKADPARNPTSRPYASWIMRPLPVWGTRISVEGYETFLIGGTLRVAIPLASLLNPNAGLEVIVSERDGHPTEALFELSQLP